MKPFPKIAFVLVVVFQLLALGGMLANREYLLRTGQVVLLKCQPIDPRSLLSGDYVRLNYTISTFREDQFRLFNRDNETFQQQDTIYVALEKTANSPFWNAAAVSHDLKKLKATYPVVMRGVFLFTWSYQVRYGVEQYFVPQFEGLQIEREIRNTSVEVAVSGSGESAIKRLFVNDQEVKFY